MTENAPKASGQPADGAFCSADKQKNCASKVFVVTIGKNGYKSELNESGKSP